MLKGMGILMTVSGFAFAFWEPQIHRLGRLLPTSSYLVAGIEISREYALGVALAVLGCLVYALADYKVRDGAVTSFEIDFGK